MSDQEQPKVSDQEEVQTLDASQQEEKKFVPADAYKEVSADMHKYKDRMKLAEARANELEAKIKAQEEAELEAKKEYQTLYEREKAEKQALANQAEQQKNLYLRATKISALKSELGGKVKDDYLSFANIDAIELKEDGTLSSESVQEVANSFRQDHPGLIEQDTSVNITGSAPGNGVITEQPAKSLDNMSFEEKAALLREIKNNNRS